MTTTLDVDVTLARRTEVRLVFGYLGEQDKDGNAHPLPIAVAVGLLQGVEDLLFLAAVVDWEAPPDDRSLRSPSGFVDNVLVKRISYASPLEVVVTFFAGLTAGTVAVNRLLNLWKNYQTVRLTTAETDLRLAALNVLQATVEAPIPLKSDSPGFDRFTNAANVLGLLSSLDVKEEA